MSKAQVAARPCRKSAPLRIASSLLSLLCVLSSASMLSSCSDRSRAPIEVTDAWSPPAPPGAAAAAVYLVVKANAADMLTGAATPVADQADMHATLESGGMMQMRPIERLELHPGESVKFEPGGKHFMLTGLRQPLPVDARFPLTLSFDKAGEVTVTVRVGPH
jgi:copper(I)-binding protein